MDFGLLPPEVNSGRMYAGPGSGPMLAAAAGWDRVAAQLESAASDYSSEVSGLIGETWFGPSSMRMAAAVTPYIAWLQASSAEAAQTSAQAYAAAAYEGAFAMTVPPPVIAANRAQLMALIATNFLGQNTPAIAATEAQYMQMWAQDVTAMYTYAADSSTASTLTAYNEPPQTTNETGQADQTRAAAQTTASAHTQTLTQQLSTAAQQASATNTVTPVDPGQTVTAPAGSTINIDSGGAAEINSGTVTVTSAGAVVDSTGPGGLGGGSLLVDAGSSATLETAAYVNGVLEPVGYTFTAGSSPIAVTWAGSYASATGVSLVSGSVTVSGATATTGPAVVIAPTGTVTATVGAAGATISNFGGSVSIITAAPVAPVAASSSGGVGAATAAASSPGLAGTAAIQPQLSVEGLAEWAHTLSGADLAAEAAAAMAG